MDNLTIEATQYTPQIELDAKGLISIVGKSYPENTHKFYAPVMEWVNTFFEEPPVDALRVEIDLIYFNSSSSKLFFDFFDILDANHDAVDIVINWNYDEENESAEEAGEDLIEDFESLTINLIAKPA